MPNLNLCNFFSYTIVYIIFCRNRVDAILFSKKRFPKRSLTYKKNNKTKKMRFMEIYDQLSDRDILGASNYLPFYRSEGFCKVTMSSVYC